MLQHRAVEEANPPLICAVPQTEDELFNQPLICIDPSRVQKIIRHFVVQCVGSRTDSIPTVDQSDIRGLVTA
jgi:hypothetical protein